MGRRRYWSGHRPAGSSNAPELACYYYAGLRMDRCWWKAHKGRKLGFAECMPESVLMIQPMGPGSASMPSDARTPRLPVLCTAFAAIQLVAGAFPSIASLDHMLQLANTAVADSSSDTPTEAADSSRKKRYRTAAHKHSAQAVELNVPGLVDLPGMPAGRTDWRTCHS